MATPTSASIIAASKDPDLIRRAVALGATLNPPLTQADVEFLRVRLAAAPVDDEGNTVASVFEYADANYQPTPRPGENPAAVTDAYLIQALGSVATPRTPTR